MDEAEGVRVLAEPLEPYAPLLLLAANLREELRDKGSETQIEFTLASSLKTWSTCKAGHQYGGCKPAAAQALAADAHCTPTSALIGAQQTSALEGTLDQLLPPTTLAARVKAWSIRV